METLRILPLSGTLHAMYRPVNCPKGTPVLSGGSVTPCYVAVAHGTVRGLGKVTDRRVAALLRTVPPQSHGPAEVTGAGRPLPDRWHSKDLPIMATCRSKSCRPGVGGGDDGRLGVTAAAIRLRRYPCADARMRAG